MSKSDFDKFKSGKFLTRKQAISAQCYECNGYSIFLSDDCLAKYCPLYQWSPWKKDERKALNLTQKPYPVALVEASRKRLKEKKASRIQKEDPRGHI